MNTRPKQRSRSREAHDELARRLESGLLAPGDRLPPERELATELGVSRATLRVALDQLEADRLIVRRQGSGTYVTEPRMSFDTAVLVSFTEGVLRKGLVPGARLLRCEVVEADRSAARALELDQGAPLWNLVRLRTANGAPLSLEHSAFPHELVPDLDRHDLERRSIYRILGEEYGLHPDRATQRFEPIAADQAVAATLGCARGESLMLVTRTAVTERSRPVEYARDMFLPSRTFFTTRARVPRPDPDSQPSPSRPVRGEDRPDGGLV